MLAFAFDASGDDCTPFLTVAGFGSTVKEWDDFSLEWKARLERDQIEYFHAADLDSFHGPFQHWENLPNRKQLARCLCRDLMDILKRHVFHKFAHTVVNKEFENLTPQLRERFALSAYSLAGRTCDKGVRDWVGSEVGFRGKPYEVVFEAGDRGKGKLQKRLLEDYKTVPIFRPKKDAVLEDGTFVSGYIPLQAADWLANEVNRMAKQFPGTLESLEQLRWPMREFYQYPHGFMGYYTPENLQVMEMGIGVQEKIKKWEIATGLGRHAN